MQNPRLLSVAICFLALVASKEAFPQASDTVLIKRDLDFLAPGREEKLDLYQPSSHSAEDRRPAVVIIHGGGFVSGDKAREREFVTGTMLANAGYIAVSVNYETRSGKRWPNNLYDCKNAVRWLRKNAAELGVDADRIGVIGGSAGGHLALMVAYTGDDPELSPPEPYPGISDSVSACVNMYGITNLLTRRVTTKDGTPTDELKGHRLFKHRREDMPTLWRKASPVSYVDKDCPPTLILHGTKDTTVDRDQSKHLHQLLLEAGAESTLNLIEGAGHAWPLRTDQFDLRPEVVEFFDRHLKQKSGENTQLKFDNVVVTHSRLQGIGAAPGVMRRDPSDIIKSDGLYYVWYSKGKISPGYDATVWYATSTDGRNWTEKGLALAKGEPGSWEGASVFTPNVLVAEGRYWLFYTGTSKKYGKNFNPDSKIGIAVADSPDGPWERLETNPALKNSDKADDFDSHLVDDACLIVRDGKYWLYYKGRQLGKSPAQTQMGLAIADQPQGPYVKHQANPVIPGNHEVLVWPQGKGVAAMIGKVGPSEITNSILYADDGIRFSKTHHVTNGPFAGGAFRPEAFTQSDDGEIPEWGVEIGRTKGEKRTLPFIQRFDISETK